LSVQARTSRRAGNRVFPTLALPIAFARNFAWGSALDYNEWR